MSKASQDKKAEKARAAVRAELCKPSPHMGRPESSKTNDANEPQWTSWRPTAEENPNQRFWTPCSSGSIVQCRFPDFLRDAFDFTQRKTRPALVTNIHDFSSGRSLVSVAYGTSQVSDDRVVGHGLAPGEFLVLASDRRSGLERDTKFSLRKIVVLPFDNDWFAPSLDQKYGVHPKRGRLDLDDPVHRRAFNQVVAEAKQLGSLLDGDGPSARLRLRA